MNQTESPHRRGSPTWIRSCIDQANKIVYQYVTKYAFKIITYLLDFDWLFYNQTFLYNYII